jgi:ATP-dependent helicase/nuclease subunit A
LRPSQPDEEPAVKSPLAAEDRTVRFRRGTLIHRLLQFLPELSLESREAAALRFLALPGHGLAPTQQQALWREVETVLNDPAFGPVFAPGSQAEVPIVGLIGRISISGQVDRLVVEERRVLIVDYKSNRPPPASEDGVDAAYRRQMAAYRAVLAAIYPDRRIDCALLWTDGPRLMPLSAALLDPHAPGG